MRRFVRGLAGVICALVSVASVGAPSASAAAAAGSSVPDKDPFYSAPGTIASFAPGQVVRSRSESVSLLGSPSVRAWQIAYRTNDSHDKPELAVTTLLVPSAAWTGTGLRPLVSSQTPEDSLGTQCAPSYTLASGNDLQDDALVAGFLNKGWAVTLPDYEGPKSAWLAGPQAGHAVLDGIRAVRRFGAAGVGARNPVAIAGYSGGAHATAWAAQLQPRYAPDVQLLGAAIGGTPADPAAVARALDGGVFSGFEFAAAYGIASEWPESGIAGLLNARGTADFAAAAGTCELSLLTNFAFRKLSEDTAVSSPLTVPSVAAVLRIDTLGASAPTTPTTPIYDYHVNSDEIVPVAQDNSLVSAWCSHGATVQTHRDLVGDHVTEVLAQMTDVTAFLSDRFAGKRPTSSC